MDIRQITEKYSVTGQIQPEDVQAIAAAGFKTLICNRPDDEDPGQPSADGVEEAARAAGLQFRHIPVVSGRITSENVEDQRHALEEMPSPVLAYCRSGTRCTNLYMLIQQGQT